MGRTGRASRPGRGYLPLIDTSALFALAQRSDENHRTTLRVHETLQRRGKPLLVRNDFLLEANTLFDRRPGPATVPPLVSNLPEITGETTGLEVVWVDEALHRTALEAYTRRSPRGSPVDQVSFRIMRSYGVTHAFAFDRDFLAAGFQLGTP